ncbi:hypothetical protein QBC43DRAFT_296963 [Cladorrhinum sp. PSN259]|nr:hypothetical protein QBC43DRAFT_296963 [Cladorrhinum sp. PSN259]
MRLATTAAVLITSLLGSTTAYQYEPSVSCGGGACAGKDENVIAALEGRRPPNATRSLNFKPFAANETEWTWRVNVTDLPLRSSSSPASNRSVQISYDFSWPGGGNLTSAYHARVAESPYCLTTALTWGTPASLTSKYASLPEAARDSGDCTPILGSSCIEAIEAVASAGTEKDCWPTTLFSVQKCGGWMGAYLRTSSPGAGENFANGFALQSLRLTNQTQSGRPFYVITSDWVTSITPTDPAVLYDQALDMLQVVILKPPAWAEGEKSKVSIKCMRLGKESETNVTSSGGVESQIETDNGNGDVNGDDDGEAAREGNDQSAASRLGGSVWGSVFGILTIFALL